MTHLAELAALLRRNRWQIADGAAIAALFVYLSWCAATRWSI